MFSIPQEIKTQTSYVSNRLISLGFLDLNDSIVLSSQLLCSVSQSTRPTRNHPTSSPSSRRNKTPVHSSTSRSKTTPPTNSANDHDNAVSPVAMTLSSTLAVDAAASNDLKVLNIINSLLSAIESDKQTRDSLLLKVETVRKEHEMMVVNLKHLEAKNSGLQRQLDSVNKLNSILESDLGALNIKNKSTQDDLTKTVNMYEKAKRDFQVELRRRDVEVSKLRQRLQEPFTRKLATPAMRANVTISVPVFSTRENMKSAVDFESLSPPLDADRLQKTSGSFSRFINNSDFLSPDDANAAGSKQIMSLSQTTPITKKWQDTLVKILKDLARDNSLLYSAIYKTQSLINQSIAQNKDSSHLHIPSAEDEDQVMSDTHISSEIAGTNYTQSLHSYLSQISPEEMNDLEAFGYDLQTLIPNPSLHNPNSPNSVHTPNTRDNLFPSPISRNGQEISKVVQVPLSINTLYSNLEQSLESLFKELHNPNLVPIEELQKRDDEINSLKEQVQKITGHWERAINTMDQWKSYREERHQRLTQNEQS